MSDSLTKKLHALHKTLVVGVVCLGIIAATNVYFVWNIVNNHQLEQSRQSFRSRAVILGNDQNYDELLVQSQARQKTHPQDPDGFFYEGFALFYKRDYAASIPAFERASKIANTRGSREMANEWIASARREINRSTK